MSELDPIARIHAEQDRLNLDIELEILGSRLLDIYHQGSHKELLQTWRKLRHLYDVSEDDPYLQGQVGMLVEMTALMAQRTPSEEVLTALQNPKIRGVFGLVAVLGPSHYSMQSSEHLSEESKSHLAYLMRIGLVHGRPHALTLLGEQLARKEGLIQ